VAAFIGFALILVLLMISLVLLVKGLKKDQRAYPLQPKSLMTAYEFGFYQRLRKACQRIGGLHIYPQVAMGAIIEVDRNVDQSRRRAIRNIFDRKIIDFVIANDEGRILVLIELDDRTHVAENDRKRDEITSSAGYKTLRIRGKSAQNVVEIQRMLQEYTN
jgi:predicted secreted protein